MKTIAIVNTKGGCGRTTTAMYLATALSRSYPDLTGAVIDGDPQGTATDWALLAHERQMPLPFEVKSANHRNLQRAISGYDWVVIDTESRKGGAGFSDAALEVADVVILPTRPLGADMARTWLSEAVARHYAPAFVLITQSLTAASGDRRATFEVLSEARVSHFETYIPLHAEIGRAHGTVPGPDFHNYDKVLAELQEVMQWGEAPSEAASEPIADLSDVPELEIGATNKAISGGALEKRTQLSIVIDPDLRDRLAIAVDLTGTSQREYVTAAIEHYIAHSGDADRIQAIYDIRKGN